MQIEHEKNILDSIHMKMKIEKNEHDIPLEKLFSMAARRNNKRSFLFVSRVLGKHIPSAPQIPMAAGRLLAGGYSRKVLSRPASFESECAALLRGDAPGAKGVELLDRIVIGEPTLFIGFAETATALGMSAFEPFGGEAYYIHTTRKDLKADCVRFMEEHSHASLHMLYNSEGIPFDKIKNVVLVDDELTTGKTVLNIIREIKSITSAERFTILTILDWRGEKSRADFESFESEIGVKIDVISLVSGSIRVEDSKWKARLQSMSETACMEDETIRKRPGKDFSGDQGLELLNLSHFFEKRIFENKSGESEALLKSSGRFGISPEDMDKLDNSCQRSAQYLKRRVRGKRVLFLGSGEFMFIPMKIAEKVRRLTGADISYHSTTRSPIHPDDSNGYAVKSAVSFKGPEDLEVQHFAYNISPGEYDQVFMFTEQEPTGEGISQMSRIARHAGAGEFFAVYLSDREGPVEPEGIGSYDEDEVSFLLKDISDVMEERGNEYREKAIQTGAHYSEMLPVEYRPSNDYMELFEHSLEQNSLRIARAVAKTAEAIVEDKGKDAVLVSLARAGTPAGILIKRYVKKAYGIDLAHYSISIIRGKGFDENAIKFISQRHDTRNVQFIDGWTGKGAIKRELQSSCEQMMEKYGIILSPKLAVIADPGGFSEIAGTSEDFLIPSACLNSTVSGLVSRTVHRPDIIGPGEFHGVKFYKELEESDVSNRFIDTISSHYERVSLRNEAICIPARPQECGESGMDDVRDISARFGIDDINLIKPGIGETTRVLLRRVPWKVLISTHMQDEDIAHILQLAREKGVAVEEYPMKKYKCCGLIKKLRGADA